MKNILVTGGAGFIGTHLVHRLKKEHPYASIMVLDNYFTGSRDNHVEGVKYIFGNTWDINRMFVTRSFEADIVFHLGEYSRIVKSFDDIQYVMKSNLRGTAEVIEYCKINGAKIIYSASSSKFGNDGADENLSPYSWAKSKGVELIKNYNAWFGLQYEICYFFNVYGPGQITKGDYATVIGIFERQMKEGKPITVVSPGTQSRDFTHVHDVVRGVEMTTHMNMNREWMLRSGKNVELLDLAKKFSDNVIMIPERKGERFTSEEFPSDTEKALNWRPENNLDDWIEYTKTK
jgi:UDP-glucose 4-epimerase